MKLTPEELEAFWVAAERHTPMLVLGAGRWGRTLLKVAASARQSVENLYLVARSNYDDTIRWRALDPALPRLAVFDTLEGCLQKHREKQPDVSPLAIIASRPDSHAADADQCLSEELDILVENPLTVDPRDAFTVLQKATELRRRVALGVEFSMSPAFHYATRVIQAPLRRATLEWEDPQNEVRHGQAKRSHEETVVLDNILPHALSIWRIFSAQPSQWSLESALLMDNGNKGSVVLQNLTSQYTLHANRAGRSRKRLLHLEMERGQVATLDFNTPQTTFTLDGQMVAIPKEWARFDSNLRLELGAFVTHATRSVHNPLTRGKMAPTPITEDLEVYTLVHEQVKNALTNGI